MDKNKLGFHQNLRLLNGILCSIGLLVVLLAGRPYGMWLSILVILGPGSLCFWAYVRYKMITKQRGKGD